MSQHHTDEAAELQVIEDDRQAENPLAAEPDEPELDEEEFQERLAALQASCPTGGCSGPQCASSVLATRYAKILRQERLLAMAASALSDLRDALAAHPVIGRPYGKSNESAAVERAEAIERQIEKERKDP